MAIFLTYGDGRSGSAAGVSGTVNTYATCTGTSGTRTVTTTLTVAIGDLIFLYQTTGTGATNCEMLKAATATSGGAFTSTTALVNTYASGAQAIKVPQYTSGTTGALSCPAWDGSSGGIAVVLANGALTIAASTSWNAKGFRAGIAGGSQHTAGTQGEGTLGTGAVGTNAANANGGGAGTDTHDNFESGGGAGGGNGVAGNQGIDNGGGERGLGGLVSGNAALSAFSLGGGGGGGSAAHNSSAIGGAGAIGGGGLIAFAPSLTISGANTFTGNNGSDAQNPGAGGGGGGGAGGSCLLGGNSVALGSSLLTAAGGTGGNAFSGATLPVGGAGGNGRFAVLAPVSSAVTGTVGIGYTFTADNSLSQGSQGYII